MAYRFEKNKNGEQDLVIDGFEKGIADSPYDGIANIRDLNISYYPGMAYVNYKRLASTISGGTMKKPFFSCQSPAGLIYVLDSGGQVWKQSAVNSTTFNLLTGNPSTGAGGQGLAFWQNYLVVWRDVAIDICGDGTGDAGVTSSNWNVPSNGSSGVWPIIGATLTLTGTPAIGSTSATISTYTDAQGSARAFWNGPTGLYQLDLGNNQVVSATLTQGSAAITWTPALSRIASGTSAVESPIPTAGNQHMALISGNDGNLYFCNGSNVGALTVPSGNPAMMRATDMRTYNFSYSALGLPQYETAVWLTELVSNLIVAGRYKLYPWDRVSTSWQNPVPIVEQIYRTINILNKIYILAGNKGSIYVSNGYSVSPLKKIPDYLSGQIDPTWTWGGIMGYRQKLYFQALAQGSQVISNVLVGVFSLDVNTGALVMEGQNSNSLTDSATGAGVLINNILPYSQTQAVGVDFYYSGWCNGAGNAGGIDYNDTTLYSSYEPFIETDIIPVGTFLQSKTYLSAEFKLDVPLLSGDKIKISARQSLSDSYILLGETTTTGVLSDIYTPQPIQKSQWIQFKIQFSCNSSGASSSFTRLREMRIR